MKTNRRVLVLGIDGASWTIIDKVIEWGGMPHLKHLLSSGKLLRGQLRSTMPPMTPPAWTSIATGVNPGKHGVYGFHRIFKRSNGFESHLMRPYDVGYPRIHEMLSVFNVPSVVVNLPITYPPWDNMCKNCVVVNDWMAPDIRIHPRELEPKFKHYFTEGIEGHLLKATSRGSLKMIAKRTKVFAEGVSELLSLVDWNLAFIVFSEPDWAMHFNPEFVGGRKPNEAVDVFKAIDEFMYKIMGEVDDIVIVSDHGFTVCDKLVNIPYYLMEYGLAEVGFHESLSIRFKGLSIPTWLVNFIRSHPKIKALVYKVLGRVGEPVSIESRQRIIPYSRAKAIMPDVGIIYSAPGYEEKVLEALKNIPGIQAVLRGSDVYWGPRVNEAPDFLLVPEKPYCMYSKKDKPFTEENTAHYPIGIVGLYGDHVDEVWWKNQWDTWDIVPLVLALLGLPVPSDTDGCYPEGYSRYGYYSRWRIAKRIKASMKTSRT